MARRSLIKSIAASLCALPFLMAGCVIHPGGWNQAKYERTVSQQAVLGTNTAIDVESRFGSITIAGAETDEFDVTATITGRAPTEEEAQELAEKTQIRLGSSGNTLQVRADTPTTGNNRSVSVSYVIAAPKRINVKCESAFGSLRVAGIEGTVAGKSSHGSIEIENIRGTVNVRTSFGSITCTNATGQMIDLQSSHGSINLADIKSSAKVQTSYGSITCEDFSDGDFHLRSGNGRITMRHGSAGECDASSSYGAVACDDFKGQTLKLSSNNGSVEATDAEAPTVGLSTSYGAVKARQVTTANVTAHSSNGSIDIVCSHACPGDLKAEVTSNYGSIDFTAPPQFAGQVHLSTHYGSVQTALPITVSGRIDKKNISGAVREGTGSIHLETGNGSVVLK
ncbi:MAG: DUF4097 family beta strand repeat protein [Sedimentisphaerales bacterium]|nr:DUF4097 family beta strand repeat protein [Sedimentisphaerales bacterium]